MKGRLGLFFFFLVLVSSLRAFHDTLVGNCGSLPEWISCCKQGGNLVSANCAANGILFFFFFLLHVVEVHKFAMNKSDVNTSKISEHGCSNPDDNPRFHLAWANQVLFHSIADKRYAENRTRRSLHGIEFPS